MSVVDYKLNSAWGQRDLAATAHRSVEPQVLQVNMKIATCVKRKEEMS